MSKELLEFFLLIYTFIFSFQPAQLFHMKTEMAIIRSQVRSKTKCTKKGAKSSFLLFLRQNVPHPAGNINKSEEGIKCLSICGLR